MKRDILIFIVLLSLAKVAMAQTINLHMNNGMVVNYNSSEVDYIDFSESSSGTLLGVRRRKRSYIQKVITLAGRALHAISAKILPARRMMLLQPTGVVHG